MSIIYKITNLLNNKIYVGKLKDTSVFETYWGSGILIQRAITRYGMITGPRNGMFGKKLSEVTRKKISLKLKGRKFTETHKKNMSNSKIGNKNPIYKILADPKKYRNFVNKMSAVTSGSNNPRALKIIRSDMHGNETIYATLKEATLSIASTDKNIYYQSRKIKEAIANNMLHKEHKWKFAE